MSGGGQEEVWVPVTVHLPLGFAKAWNPNKCAPISLLCGPYVIILFAMLGNTLLVPVLPFLVKETGSGARDYVEITASCSPLCGSARPCCRRCWVRCLTRSAEGP